MSTGETLRFEDFELDTQRFELRRSGKLVPVEPQVFEILAHLARHRDRVVTREELLEQVWKDPYISESAVASRLMAARRAIDDDGTRQRFIKTIHGRGLRFVAELSLGTPRQSPKSALVGREQELESLRLARDEARTGTRTITLITAPPGGGKTSLIRSFLEEVEQDVLLIDAQCFKLLAPEPYGPLVQAVSDLVRRRPELADTVKEVAPSFASSIPSLGADQPLWAHSETRMTREWTDLLERLGSREETLLVLDDAHWADTSTLATIAFSATRHAYCRATYIVGMRLEGGDEPSETATRWAQDLVLRHGAKHLDLKPLAEHEIRALREEDATDVARLTGGHPLFVRRVIDELERGASLSELPRNMKGIVEHLLSDLSEEELPILRVAACAGRTFTGELAAFVLGTDLLETERRLEALVRQGRTIARGEAVAARHGRSLCGYRFLHDVVSEALAEGVPPIQGRSWHLKIGQWLESELDHPVPHEVAGHYRRAQDAEGTIVWLAKAAELSLNRAASSDALCLSREAQEWLERLAAGHERWKLRLMQIEVAAMVATEGWGSDVEGRYEEALRLAEELGDEKARFDLTHGYATLTELRGEYDRTERLLHGLDEAAACDLLACSAFHQGRFEECLRHVDVGLSSVNRSTHIPIMAFYGEKPTVALMQWRALALWFVGRPTEALEMMRLALDDADQSPYAVAYARAQTAYLQLVRRDAASARHWAQKTIDSGREHGLPYRLATGQIVLGWAMGMHGLPEEGAAQGLEGLKSMERLGVALDRPFLSAAIAETLYLAGRAQESQALLDDAIDAARRKPSFFWLEELLRLRGSILGDKMTLESARAVAEQQGCPTLILRTLDSLVQAGMEARSQIGAYLERAGDGVDPLEKERVLAQLRHE